jgi:hypothetical protein
MLRRKICAANESCSPAERGSRMWNFKGHGCLPSGYFLPRYTDAGRIWALYWPRRKSPRSFYKRQLLKGFLSLGRRTRRMHLGATQPLTRFGKVIAANVRSVATIAAARPSVRITRMLNRWDYFVFVIDLCDNASSLNQIIRNIRHWKFTERLIMEALSSGIVIGVRRRTGGMRKAWVIRITLETGKG